MIQINLLPEELKKKKARVTKVDFSKVNIQDVPVLKIIGGAFAVLLVISGILFLIGLYADSTLASLERRYKEISPKKKEADSLKVQVDVIKKKVTAIDELMVNRFSWTKKLNDLSDSVTPGIWLTELSYDERASDRAVVVDERMVKRGKGPAVPAKPVMEKVISRYLYISGYASSKGEEGTALIGKFIKSLKDNNDFYSDFNNIELGAIKRDKVEDQETMSFRITCLFKELKDQPR